MAAVTLDSSVFRARFPEFISVGDAALEMYFVEASMLLDPTDDSRVTDEDQRAMLLYLLTAHLSYLYSGANGEQASQLVGRINTATEGTVSVGLDDMHAKNPTQAWYMQTKYGAQYWALTSPYRRMQYQAGRSYPLIYRGGAYGYWR